MKKFFKNIIVIGTAAALVLGTVSCGNSGSDNSTASTTSDSENTEKAEETENTVDISNETILFATHEVGSSNYNLSVELAKLWEEKGGLTVDVQPISPGGMGAPYLFEAGKTDVSFINGAPAKWANEDGTLGKEPIGGYQAMIGGLTNVSAVNFMTKSFMDKHGVETIEEAIRQQLPIRIGCSPVGSMDNEVVNILLDYLEVTEEDIQSFGGSIVHGGGSELSSMVKDGKIDFMLDHTSPSSSTMTEIAMTSDVQFLQWEDATIEYFINEKGFQRVTLPANSFNKQTEDIINAGTPDCIFISETVSDDIAYELTKIMCENRDYLVGIIGSIAPFDPETAWQSEKNGGIPLHPGAERYYKEAGYMN